MSTITITKATVQDNLDLAKKLWVKGISPEDSLIWLKSKHYRVDNIQYQGTAVAQGIAMLVDINNGALAGKVGANKTKGLHIK